MVNSAYSKERHAVLDRSHDPGISFDREACPAGQGTKLCLVLAQIKFTKSLLNKDQPIYWWLWLNASENQLGAPLTHIIIPYNVTVNVLAHRNICSLREVILQSVSRLLRVTDIYSQ